MAELSGCPCTAADNNGQRLSSVSRSFVPRISAAATSCEVILAVSQQIQSYGFARNVTGNATRLCIGQIGLLESSSGRR